MIFSIFLILFSFNAAAWDSSDMDDKMDSMKADLDTTFAAKFGPSSTDDTTTDANNDNSGSVTVEQDAEVNGQRSSQYWSSDDSESDSVDMEKKMDGVKQHINAKFSFHSSDDTSDDSSEHPDETDDSNDDTTGDESNSDSSWDYNNDQSSDDSSNDDSTDNSGDDSSDDTNDNTDSDWTNPDDSSSDDSSSDDSSSQPLSMEEETEQILHNLINQERRQRGLQPFNWDSGLAETADYKSDDMASRGYFAHSDPEGDNFRDIYNQFGYNCRLAYGGSIYLGGENIARTWFNRNVRTDTGSTVHYDNAQELADGLRRQWMTSDAHRRAILRPYYENHGLGVEVTSDGRVYATEHFC